MHPGLVNLIVGLVDRQEMGRDRPDQTKQRSLAVHDYLLSHQDPVIQPTNLGEPEKTPVDLGNNGPNLIQVGGQHDLSSAALR